MTYVIAEIGNNHEGSMERARGLVDAAADAGADAVKFQIYRPEMVVSEDAPALVGEGTQRDRLRAIALPMVDYVALCHQAHERGLEVVCTFLDEELIREHYRMVDRLKIASGDVTHLSLIAAANETGLSVLISVGLSRCQEIDAAVHRVTSGRCTVLHCVSEYPCPAEWASLDRMSELRARYYRVGYSDHCCGIEACVAAAALGAEVIEKHFTDARRDHGDHVHSATPGELRELVSRIRHIESMREVCYMPSAEQRKRMMRGAYATRDIEKGETIGEDDLIALRPCTGRTPWALRGTRAQKDYRKGEPIR